VTFVSFLSTIRLLCLLVLLKVSNNLILFTLVFRDLPLFIIFLVRDYLFLLFTLVACLFFLWRINQKYLSCSFNFTIWYKVQKQFGKDVNRLRFTVAGNMPIIGFLNLLVNMALSMNWQELTWHPTTKWGCSKEKSPHTRSCLSLSLSNVYPKIILGWSNIDYSISN
jgi:hypothetical protein